MDIFYSNFIDFFPNGPINNRLALIQTSIEFNNRDGKNGKSWCKIYAKWSFVYILLSSQ